MIFQDLQNLPKKYGSEKKEPFSGINLRSNMMLNPLQLKHLNRLDELKAHMITLNLEDAIALSRKKEALENIALFLSYTKKANSKIIVRVNPLDEGGIEEIKFLNDFGFDAIRVAKVKTIYEVEKALKLIKDDKELHISLETKEAFNSLASFGIDSRFTTANLGILDLLNSLGLSLSIITLDNPTIEYILSKFLVDAKTANLLPISFMFQKYNDTATFEAWCKKEKSMGFSSKACMGPKQVDVANKIFMQDDYELQKAKVVIEEFERMSTKNINGFMHEEYGFIDEPIYKWAKQVLDLS